MSLCGEDAESGEQLKQLLLHHCVGRVQGCGVQEHAVKIRRRRSHIHVFSGNLNSPLLLIANQSVMLFWETQLDLCP